MKLRIFTGIFFLLCIHTSGQVLNYFKDIKSPQVALVDRYGSYPVDFSTGLVDVSIPLYTIKTTSLTIPLQLKFHASGLRADEREGLFGIRWALFGLGQITRQIKGYPDELYQFNNNVHNPNQDPNFYDLFGTTSGMVLDGGLDGSYNGLFTGGGTFEDPNGKEISFTKGQYQDTEYDIFSYTLPSGKSGKFIVQGSYGIPMPYEPIKIIVDRIDPSPIQKITIIDENGDTYHFGGTYVDYNDNNWSTTWHLSTVVSANHQDTIQMSYVYPNLQTTFCNSSMIITDEMHDQDCFEPGGYCSFYATCAKWLVDPYFFFDQEDCSHVKFTNQARNSTMIYNPLSIKSIQFNSGGVVGNVNFSYAGDNYGNPTYLKKMTVSNAQSSIIKQLQFDLHKNNNGTGNLMFLDSIEFIDNLSTQKYYYTFHYYDSSSVPACGSLMLNCDWWGYYSAIAGAFNNESVNVLHYDDYGNQISTSYTIAGGGKSSDLSSMEIGMIKTINYPTGGQTNFNYQANTYSGGICGGLRIANITNISNSGKTETKSYDYGGAASIMPCYLHPLTQIYGNCNYGFTMFTNFFTENEVNCFAAVTANEVGNMEQSILVGNNASGGKYIKRTFSTTVPNSYSDFDSNIVYYPIVTETSENTSGQTVNGKTVYQYDINTLGNSFYDALGGNTFTGWSNNNDGIGYQQMYVSPTDFWKTKRLKSKTIYKGYGTQKIKEYFYTDTTYYTQQPIYDLPVFRYRISNVNITDGYYINNNDQEEIALIYPINNNNTELSKTFAFKHQKYTVGADKLSKETEISYYDDGSTSTIIKKHTYDPTYLLPVADTLINSNGDVIVTTKQYPFNLISGVYPNMVSQNILNDVVNVFKSKNKTSVESTTLNYQMFYNNYRPENIIRIDNSGNIDSLVTHMQFDNKGNPQYILKTQGEKLVYLWGYNNQNQIAKIEGLTYDQVVNAVGSDLINSLASSSNPTKDQIEQIRSKINSSGLPAMVTTYSYSPLVGMVTATDPKGVTTSYTYDTFNRLYFIRNDDKDVLAKYRYGFQNDPDNGTGGYNVLKATSITTDASSYVLNTSGTATANITGGSGNYTYTWTLTYINGGGTTTIQTTTPSLPFTCAYLGTLVIQCTVTDNQLGSTATLSTGVSVATSAFTMLSGFASSYGGANLTGSTVNVSLNIYPVVSAMQVGTSYCVANIMSSYMPSAPRTITLSLNGRTWSITIYPGGSMYFMITSGSALPTYSGVTFTFSYSK